MKCSFVFALLLASAAAAPAADTKPATIVRDISDVRPDGYKFDFETSDGFKHGAEGTIQQVGTESILSVKGSYSYTAPDGQVISVNYIADQNGFQPDNLPVGP